MFRLFGAAKSVKSSQVYLCVCVWEIWWPSRATTTFLCFMLLYLCKLTENKTEMNLNETQSTK